MANIILWVVTGILIFILILLHLARHCKKPQWIVRKLKWLRTFYALIGALAILGGTWAFFLPVAINSGFTKNDDGPTLRQLLIYTTGGILGVITLGETRRKNDQEHIRQVHAERRSRYATAIEQLADEKAPIRFGGVYTLVKLVDEWLADEKTLPSEEERRQEGQIIINSLCAYIRSSFDLVSKADVLSNNEVPDHYEGGVQQFTIDQARLREEKELRTTILGAIKIRLNGGIIHHQNGTPEISKGSWSDFDYDFSKTRFFYPVNFSKSHFGASSNFAWTTFVKRADFSLSIFTKSASFTKTTFTDGTGFSAVTFAGNADFSGVTFTRYAKFNGATFTDGTGFSEVTFAGNADFSGVTFTRYAKFNGATFTEDADFSGVTFTGFMPFTASTDFSGAIFTGKTDFSGAIFTGDADFSGVTFRTEPKFGNIRWGKTYKARFSSKANPEDYNFEVSHDSPYKIETWEQEHNGVKFIIPKDTELFDPDKSYDLEDNEDI